MKQNCLTAVMAMVFSVMLTLPAKGQDLIVTAEGDSLNCHIDKIKKKEVYFTINNEGKVIGTMLPLDKVASYSKGYFGTTEDGASPVLEVVEGTVAKERLPHFRIGAYGGLGWRVGALPKDLNSDVRAHLKNLRFGTVYSADAAWYISDFMGVGVKGSYLAVGKESAALKSEDGAIAYGRVRTTFVGPFFAMRYYSVNMRHSFLANFGLGYLGYRDTASAFGDYQMTGSTLGLLYEIGYDFHFNKTLSWGVALSEVAGQLTSMESRANGNTRTIQFDKGAVENISHLQIMLGIHFEF